MDREFVLTPQTREPSQAHALPTMLIMFRTLHEESRCVSSTCHPNDAFACTCLGPICHRPTVGSLSLPQSV